MNRLAVNSTTRGILSDAATTLRASDIPRMTQTGKVQRLKVENRGKQNNGLEIEGETLALVSKVPVTISSDTQEARMEDRTEPGEIKSP